MTHLRYIFCLALIIAGFAFSAWNNSVFAQGKQKAGVTYDANITRVIDGDTVAFEAAWLPDPLKKELSIRVFGVDTPEKGHRAQCPQEDAKGQAASKFTKDMIASSQKRQVVLMDWDKYGGRVLGDVILNGQSLRAMLISKGYAREYYGEAKTSWCN
jgi:endonuclease YncB( thermonuclease family)